MAFLSDQDRRDILTGEVPADGGGPIVVPGSGGGDVGGGSFTATAPQSAAGPSPGFAPTPEGAPHLGELGDSLGRIRADLGGIQEEFRSALPKEATFTEQDRAGLSNFAENPFSAASPEQLSRYRSLVDDSYSGPAGLDEERTRGLSLEADKIRSQGLAAARGFGAIERAAGPGLTRGEALYNLGRGNRLADFRQEGAQLAGAARGFQEDLNTARDEALAMTGQRKQSFADRAGQARDLLGGIREGVDTSEAQRLEEFNTQEDQLLEAYRQLQETGDISTIAPFIQEDQQNAFQSIQADERLRGEAQQLAKAIIDRYPEIKDYSLASMTTDKKGRTRWNIKTPSGRVLWLYKDHEHFPPGVVQQLINRQAEIDSLFASSPHSPNYPDSRGRDRRFQGLDAVLDKWNIAPTREFLDAADYVDLQRSPVEASTADIRTEEDAATLQRIADLLGTGEQFQAGNNLAPRFNIREGEFESRLAGLEEGLRQDLIRKEQQEAIEQRKRNRKRNESKFSLGRALMFAPFSPSMGIQAEALRSGAVDINDLAPIILGGQWEPTALGQTIHPKI